MKIFWINAVEFNDAQRNGTLRAAELAGLTVLRTIYEPTAAAMAYVTRLFTENSTKIQGIWLTIW